jgi:hypothetical protein
MTSHAFMHLCIHIQICKQNGRAMVFCTPSRIFIMQKSLRFKVTEKCTKQEDGTKHFKAVVKRALGQCRPSKNITVSRPLFFFLYTCAPRHFSDRHFFLVSAARFNNAWPELETKIKKNVGDERKININTRGEFGTKKNRQGKDRNSFLRPKKRKRKKPLSDQD